MVNSNIDNNENSIIYFIEKRNTKNLLKKLFILILLFFSVFECSLAQEQWYSTSVPRERHVNAVKFLGPNDILFGGGNEFNGSLQDIWISSNKGMQWNITNDIIHGQAWIKSMAFINDLQGYAVGDSATILRTINGTQSWTVIPKPIQNREFSKIIYVTPKILFIVGGTIPYPEVVLPGGHIDTMQTIVKSVDSGKTWTVVLDRKGFWLNGVSFTDTLNGIAVGDKGQILKTTNGGLNWATISPPVVRDFRGIRMISPSVGYIVGGIDSINRCCPIPIYIDSFSTILRTNNGGTSWTVLKDDKAGILNDITFTNDSVGYIVGDKATLLKTTNAGLNWNPVVIPGADPLQTFLCVEFRNDHLGAIGARGGFLHVYTTSIKADAYTLGATYVDSVTFKLIGGFNTHGEVGTFRFYFSTDSTLGSYRTFYPGDIQSNAFAMIETEVSQLIPDTTYYYYIQVRTLAGYTNGDTLTFHTSKSTYTFQTLEATNVLTNSGTLNGYINKLPTSATLSFEYGLTSLSGSTVPAVPNSINDTFAHTITAFINNLAPNSSYFFRLKGTFNSESYYGNIVQMSTLNPFQTLPVTNVTNTSATLNGVIDKLGIPATISFEYGTTSSFGNEITAIPGTVNDTFAHVASASLSGLQPNTSYYYRLKGTHNADTYYGITQTFFTGTLFKTLQTLPATNVIDSSVVLNGIVDKFQVPATISFEYGPTINFGNEIMVNSSPVTDTLQHTVNASLNSLAPNIQYYFRIKAQTALATFYGEILVFHASLDYSFFNTTAATNITNTSAQINGIGAHLSNAVTLSFEWGPTPALGNTAASTPASISDTLTHTISANLSGLVQDEDYFFRLKAIHNGSPVYGDTKQFYTGSSEVPNWDFQFWDMDTTNIPNHWSSFNHGFERVPGHSGNYAIKIFDQTFVLNGILGEGFFGGSPVSFSAPPDSIVMYANYNVDVTDSAGMMVLLKKNGQVIGTTLCFTLGNTLGLFKRMAYKLNYDNFVVPDTVMIGLINTNFLGAGSPFNNNVLTVDDISFLPGNITFENSNFEDWFPTIMENPVSWFCLNYFGLDSGQPDRHMVSKVYFDPPSDYAASVTNLPWGSYVIGGSIVSAITITGLKGGGFPIKGKHLTLNGYYKYFPSGDDTMDIMVSMNQGSTFLGSGQLLQSDSITEFTPFSIPIDYQLPGVPDTAVINIRSSISRNPRAGSTVIIDKFSFDGFVAPSIPTYIHESFSEDGIKVYPNPTRDHLIVENSNPENEPCTLFLISINGQTVREVKLTGTQNNARIETGNLRPGTYIIVLKKGNDTFYKKVIIL